MDKIKSKVKRKFKRELIEEMIKQGATENDLKLIKDSIICNAIKTNRTVQDVAWALLS